MSEESIEIVRQAYEAINERDFSRTAEFLHPDVEFDMSRNILNPDIYRGYEGFRRLVGVVEGTWVAFRFDVRDLVEQGDLVVADITVSGIGRRSGVKAEMRVFNVVTLRAGRIIRLAGGFKQLSEALEAAGLSE